MVEDNKQLKLLAITLALILPIAMLVAVLLSVRFYPQLSAKLPEMIVGDNIEKSDDKKEDENEVDCQKCIDSGDLDLPVVPSKFEIVREAPQDGTIYLYYSGSGSFGDRNNFFITYPEFRTADRVAECKNDFTSAGIANAACEVNIGAYYPSYPNTSMSSSSYAHYKQVYGIGIGLTNEVSSYIRLVKPSKQVIDRIREEANISMTLNPENTKLYLVIQDIVGNDPSDSQLYEYDLETGSEKMALEFKGEEYEAGIEQVMRIDGKYLTISGTICYACDAPQRKAYVVDTSDFSQVNLGIVSDLKIYSQSGHATFLNEQGEYKMMAL